MFDVSREASRVASQLNHRTLSVEHVFLAAIEQLWRDYSGGGVFHYLELYPPVLGKLVRGVSLTQETRWNASLPDVLGEHEARVALERAGGGVRMIGMPGPPPGWPPPATKEYVELVARFAKRMAEHRAPHPTIYEALFEVISYPQVAPLLEEIGYSKESFQQRLQPYLDPKVAAQEIGPNVRRYSEVMLALDLGLEPPLEEPATRFRIYMAASVAMLTGSDTITLTHLFLAGVEQALRGGRAAGTLLPDPLLESFLRSTEWEVTTAPPLSAPYSKVDRVTGEKVVYGKVPLHRLKVPPTVEQFLQKHRLIAARRQLQFTSYPEVIASLLRYGEIKNLLKKLGYHSQQIRAHVQRLASTG